MATAAWKAAPMGRTSSSITKKTRPSVVMLRIDPPNLIVSGITFPAWPASTKPTETTYTAIARMAKDAARMGSLVSWGRAACPPFPLIVAINLPEAASIGPAHGNFEKSIMSYCEGFIGHDEQLKNQGNFLEMVEILALYSEQVGVLVLSNSP
ncbi:hypothetical protein SADUNF_Sadunf16G0066700 [Salix dunnii]|uniref:Uncharacterized protein n=1 Tax=Salix dunnii TaxID=1413687 RepID=A0A835J5F2_9ROSI|nr:hypothetical protein SADUNF_Sadunf16G0066700 [Salix dunnii]